jgi:hypothetical protein
MGAYLVDMYEQSHVPPGKRGLSVLHQADDAQDALTQLQTIAGPNRGHRHLDYVDFHNYAAESGLDTSTLYNQVRAVFPDSTVLLGEFGYDATSPALESAQVSTVASTISEALTSAIPIYMLWMLTDNTPGPGSYALTYTYDQPKDVVGYLAGLFGAVKNGDFETVVSGAPQHWSGGGNTAFWFGAIGPQASDAATGLWYGRVRADQPGSVWMSSDMTPVVGGKRLFVNAYLRSNLAWVNIDVHEYDASGVQVGATTSGPRWTPPTTTWQWYDYLHAVGSFSVQLRSDTKWVIVAPAGATGSAIPGYLDVDALSVSVR